MPVNTQIPGLCYKAGDLLINEAGAAVGDCIFVARPDRRVQGNGAACLHHAPQVPNLLPVTSRLIASGHTEPDVLGALLCGGGRRGI